MNTKLAVLTGNGLSVAYNPNLNLSRLTKKVIEEIKKNTIDHENFEVALRNLAALIERDIDMRDEVGSDFERLVGALGAETDLIGHLGRLCEAAGEDVAVRDALRESEKFARKIKNNGISHVLEVIYRNSRITISDKVGIFRSLQAMEASFSSQITISNLNYDTILLAALVQDFNTQLADMADGRGKHKREVRPGEPPVYVWSLRKDASMLTGWRDRKFHLVHLHGSLTYWRTDDQATDATCNFKVSTDVLSSHNLIQGIRNEEGAVYPDVVLANSYDKPNHVKKFPFNICYEVFGDSLKNSEHWLIIGYSFRDTPVNNHLRHEFLSRVVKPKVLVVTHDTELSRDLVRTSLGWGEEDSARQSDDAWLSFDRCGAVGFEERQPWKDFVRN